MTFTKEWLQKAISDIETMRDEIPFGLDEDGNNTLAALKLALAGMEAEPVVISDDMAYAFHHAFSDSSLGADEVEEIKTGLRAAFANVPAPQPLTTSERAELENYRNAEFMPKNLDRALTIMGVSLPESKEEFNLQAERWMQRLIDRVIRCESEWNAQQVVPEWTNEQCLEFLSIAFRHAEIKGDLEMDDIRLGVKMVNACRAAMLQGAENAESRCTIQTAPALDSSPKIAESRCSNAPAVPDGWVACSERMPDVGDVVLTAKDGFVNVGEMERSGANYRFFTSIASGRELSATHWQPLPAAPKQEAVSSALGHGMARYSGAMQKLADGGD